jgi:PAP2 superfamily protein
LFARPDHLSAGMRAVLGPIQRKVFSTWWRELILVGILYGAYEISRGLGDVDVSTALSNGREILHLERVWHLDPEGLLNGALHHATFVAVLASYFYSLMHYLVTPVVLVWMYRSHRAEYGFARTALALSTAIGLIGYLLLPTAPPRMLGGSGLRDILADTQHWGWWGDEGSVPKGLGGLTNQFAAMPSLHVGWAVWCGVLIAIYAEHRWVRIIGASYPILTTLVVMATGNHYLLDAIAGVVVMGLGALLTAALPKRFVTVPMGPAATVIDGLDRHRSAGVQDRSASVSARRIADMPDWPAVPDDARGVESDDDRQFCRTRR